MIEDALSFWTEIQRYEDMLAADAGSPCFAPLSELYRKLGLIDDAISVARKGCALHPDHPVGFLALGNACYDKGLTAEARQALERTVSLKPDHLQALRLLGQIYVEQGEMLLARKVLGQVLQQDPDDMESSLLLSTLGAPAPASQPEEEILEELEIIEDLDEILEEPSLDEISAPAAQPQSALSASAGIGLAQEAASRAPSAPAEEDEDLWAIEDFDEPETTQPLQALPQAQPKTEQPQPARQAAPDPLTTATLAELYVSQGFIDKALNIYDELLQSHPSNQQYQLRYAEIQEIRSLQHLQPEVQQTAQKTSAPEPPQPAPQAAQPVQQAPQQPQQEPASMTPAAQVTATAPQGDVQAELSRWIDNIRRRRDGV
ncbi:MAG TPA: hypothetical protein DCZ75_13275 [Geobacter sp.]|nr:hypothetical protein [Geobacter sp.]